MRGKAFLGSAYAKAVRVRVFGDLKQIIAGEKRLCSWLLKTALELETGLCRGGSGAYECLSEQRPKSQQLGIIICRQ